MKGKKCNVLDPERAEVSLKVQWDSYHVPDTNLWDAVEGFGRVEGVERDVWRVDGFEGIKSTTQIVRMTINSDVTLESLPHQLQLLNSTALVVVFSHPQVSAVPERGTRIHEVDAVAPEAPGNTPVEHEARRVVDEDEPSGAIAKKQAKPMKQRCRTSSKTSEDYMNMSDQATRRVEPSRGPSTWRGHPGATSKGPQRTGG